MDTASSFERGATGAEMKIPSGVAIAALLAAVIGLLVLAIVNIAADVNAPFRDAITYNKGIGPYSGKEVFMFGGWFVSWIGLHFALRKRDLNVKKWFGVTMVLLLAAALLVWPPIFEAIADAIKGA